MSKTMSKMMSSAVSNGHLSSRIFDKPLLMSASSMAGFLTGFSNRDGLTNNINITQITDGEGKPIEHKMFSGGSSPLMAKPYQVMNGVAIIDVSGTLVNKSGHIKSHSGLLGYDGIETQFLTALEDDNVSEILFDMDSGGGEVSGCFDLCDLIFGFRNEKPTTAFVGESANSACYALASSCSNVFIPRTGSCGSVGVLVAHTDVSAKMEKLGEKVTIIHSGAHKIDGNPFETLPDDVRSGCLLYTSPSPRD